uniref:DUF4220 domain-containing protein n=1 Tax=Gongylonema pulchrum TaxID=637853 RepID=A0A183DJU1_9BILA
LAVLCEGSYLMKWLELEREGCIAGVENLLASEDCWKNRYQNLSDVDVVIALLIYSATISSCHISCRHHLEPESIACGTDKRGN